MNAWNSQRIVVLAGRAEAVRLCRNPLVLASLAAAAALIWWNSRSQVPRWWVWEMQLDSTLLALSAATLVAAQLAASRIRRDDAEHLYDSYPTPAPARTAAFLLGLAGPLLLAVVLAAAAIGWLDLQGPAGTPRLAVLAQGLLLVALGGVLGVVLGTWLPSPAAGFLTVIVLGAAEADLLLPSYDAPVRLPGGTAWLFPWTQPGVPGWLPGPVGAIPPASHLAWLASLTGLAVIAALWRPAWRASRGRTAGLLAPAAAACLAATAWSGWAQTRPVPDRTVAGVFDQAAHPALFEHCVSEHGVAYCYYPGFGPWVSAWAGVVDGVLSRLPGRPAGSLLVRQVDDNNFTRSDLGYVRANAATAAPEQEYAMFLRAEGTVPGGNGPPVYVDLDWGRGAALGSYQLGLAVQVAWRVAGLPTTARNVTYSWGPGAVATAQVTCLPADQAREAVALWLAASATPAARASFLAGAVDYDGPAGPGYLTPVKVAGRWIDSYQPAVAGYVSAVTYTGQGAALADAMLRLPEARVKAVLAARWPGWLSPGATAAQLAAALGVPLPPQATPRRSEVNQGQPSDPVCR